MSILSTKQKLQFSGSENEYSSMWRHLASIFRMYHITCNVELSSTFYNNMTVETTVCGVDSLYTSFYSLESTLSVKISLSSQTRSATGISIVLIVHLLFIQSTSFTICFIKINIRQTKN